MEWIHALLSQGAEAGPGIQSMRSGGWVRRERVAPLNSRKEADFKCNSTIDGWNPNVRCQKEAGNAGYHLESLGSDAAWRRTGVVDRHLHEIHITKNVSASNVLEISPLELDTILLLHTELASVQLMYVEWCMVLQMCSSLRLPKTPPSESPKLQKKIRGDGHHSPLSAGNDFLTQALEARAQRTLQRQVHTHERGHAAVKRSFGSPFFIHFLICLTFSCWQDAKTPSILRKSWKEVIGQVPQNVMIYDTHTHIDRHGFS
jgi:hypothetical protein